MKQRRAEAAYLCRFQPEPEGGFTVTCPKLPPVVTYGPTLKEAQANTREAIELCLEVMREAGQPIPPPDGDLTSPIEQRVLRHRTDPTRQTVVPVHRGDMPPGTLDAILRQARLTPAEFLDLL